MMDVEVVVRYLTTEARIPNNFEAIVMIFTLISVPILRSTKYG